MSRFFDVSPQEEWQAHILDRAVEMIQDAFPQIELDAPAALLDAERRKSTLIAAKAPEEIIAIYENPKVTRIRVTEDWCKGAYLEFDLWDCQGIHAYPKPQGSIRDCEILARKLAEVLGYSCAIEEFD